MSGVMFFWLVGRCLGQSQAPPCPKHIETPAFPPIARAAHVTGIVVLSVTIGADGSVSEAEVTNSGKSAAFLKSYAIENIRHWTFTKPTSAPYIATIAYDYEFDPALPPSGGPSSLPTIEKVIFDLPDRVTLLTNLRIIDTSQSTKHE
jgi:TonB family protein